MPNNNLDNSKREVSQCCGASPKCPKDNRNDHVCEPVCSACHKPFTPAPLIEKDANICVNCGHYEVTCRNSGCSKFTPPPIPEKEEWEDLKKEFIAWNKAQSPSGLPFFIAEWWIKKVRSLLASQSKSYTEQIRGMKEIHPQCYDGCPEDGSECPTNSKNNTIDDIISLITKDTK